MSATAPARSSGDRTLLQALVQERHLTREQMIDVLDRQAREMGIKDFALSLRQVDRWFAGRVATAPRPSVCRVIEAEFGYPVDELLAPDARPAFRRAPLPAASNRNLRTVDFLSWIADHSGSSFEVLYAAVSALADGLAAEPFSRPERRNSTPGRGSIGHELLRPWSRTTGPAAASTVRLSPAEHR
jgi:hypothetical protein